MIIASDHGEVRFFRMARTLFGRALYWTGVYLVDGLLIDSGPPNMRRRVARVVDELGVRQCVTTPDHEDHSGNHDLLNARGIVPLAQAAGLASVHDPPRCGVWSISRPRSCSASIAAWWPTAPSCSGASSPS